jgi:hypothetical protein
MITDESFRRIEGVRVRSESWKRPQERTFNSKNLNMLLRLEDGVKAPDAGLASGTRG